ncbi:hypothetical protein M514_06872 [Trichuris suis]|uniref:Uncharacterized protein n=1 Tax=Trichuris suis TaxID=68888 RepID=A0A085NBB6_9BILA|nr:hypothetical protein M513_06872 [Trichuris suis]KFD66762.1 hypothetical protein M514_06872 [Trichuris suis]
MIGNCPSAKVGAVLQSWPFAAQTGKNVSLAHFTALDLAELSQLCDGSLGGLQDIKLRLVQATLRVKQRI